MNKCKNSNKDARIYFISTYDNLVHNIYDTDYELIDEHSAEVGKKTQEGLRVDEEVCLHTLEEIVKFF